MILFNPEQLYIVTGASSGIGKEVALLLNSLGARVVAIARNVEKLNEVKDQSDSPSNIYIEQKDLTDDINELPEYIKQLKEKYGKFTGLVYSAGIAQIKPLSILDLTDIEEAFNINYLVPIMLIKGVVDRRNNVGEGTSIVAISSAAAKSFDRGHVSYSGSKAALSASCVCIAKEVAKAKVRVNCILPSDIQTPMTEAVQELRVEDKEKYPLGFGETEDVANMVAFLLSDRSKWITGQNYILDCASL